MIRDNSIIQFYEIEDGQKVVLEFIDLHHHIEHEITIERSVAINLCKDILEMLGDY